MSLRNSYSLVAFFSLYALLSCNPNATEETTTTSDDVVTPTPDSGFVVENYYRPSVLMSSFSADDLYFTLYRQNLEMNGDTIPKKKIIDIIGRDVFSKRMENSSVIIDVSPDSIAVALKKMAPWVIYETDNRIDILEAKRPERVDDGRRVAVIIEKKYISLSNGDYTFSPKGKYGQHYNLCDIPPPYSERFFDQEIASHCSAAAIDSFRLITAGHCITRMNMNDYYIVFDYMLKPGAVSMEKAIPESNIYTITKVSEPAGTDISNDFRLLTVNKEIPTFRICRYRKSGKVANNAMFYVIGSPCGLPLKLSDSATIITNDAPGYFKINSDTYKGNSGSPVFNAATRELEGLLIEGENDFHFTPSESCRTSIRCEAYACSGEGVVRTSRFLKLIQ